MNIEVKNCSNCPFLYQDFDPDSMGCDTCDICILSKGKVIRCYDSYSESEIENQNIQIPEWCLLKEESIKIQLK